LESVRERKFPGAKVPGSESSTPELSLPGANGLGSEKSIILEKKSQSKWLLLWMDRCR